MTGDGVHRSFAVRAAPALAALLALATLGGILLRSTYARETSTWAAQGTGQDWVNLLVVVPWMSLSGRRAARGSRRALLLLGGGLIYLVYGFLAYAFAVHFNVLFLLYCAVLGLSFFSLPAWAAFCKVASYRRGSLRSVCRCGWLASPRWRSGRCSR
jgi:hypothetical protein